MRKSLTIVLCMLVSVAVIANFSCRKSSPAVGKKLAEKAIEQASGGKAKVDLGSGGNVDISSLPEALRYPGAKATAKFSMSGEEGKGASYILETADPAKSVVTFYKQAMAGWKQSMTMETEKGTVMGYATADDKQGAVITVGFNDEKKNTTISIVYSLKD